MTIFSHGRDTICPPWCEKPAGHVASPEYCDHEHLRTVAQMDIPEIDGIRSAGEKPVTVQIQGPVDRDGQEWPAVINVSLSCSGGSDDEQDLTADEARALAVALQQAAELIADS